MDVYVYMHVCMCVCVYTQRPIVVAERRRRIYLRRGKVGSTEPATKVSRSAVDSEYIWSSAADLWTARGFTASEQQADNRTFTGETGGIKRYAPNLFEAPSKNTFLPRKDRNSQISANFNTVE